MNRIYIIGSGAIGQALAFGLKAKGKEIILLHGRASSGARSIKKIRLTTESHEIKEQEVVFDTIDNLPELDGTIILTAKSYSNKMLSDRLASKARRSAIVLLQNGLGVEQPFLDNHFPEVYRCVLFVTSQFVDESTVRFRPVSDSLIGAIKGNSKKLNAIVEDLSSPFFPFKAEDNIQAVIWKKAIINSVFNSICPLLEADNGIFHRDDAVLALADRVIGECVEVAKREGIVLGASEVQEKLLQISRSSDGQLISTLQDINQGRQTEIETLNLEISRRAIQHGIADHIVQTKLLGELVLLKSHLKLAANGIPPVTAD